MTTVKDVILTAIHFKGLTEVENNAADLADKLFCSSKYILTICSKVRSGKIVIR